ncbi:MAG: hypothetical protein ACFFD3_15015 [Candidatus Thorarchaeota archaeon]
MFECPAIFAHSRGHTEPLGDDVVRIEWDTRWMAVCRKPTGRAITDLHDRDVCPLDEWQVTQVSYIGGQVGVILPDTRQLS